MNRGPSNAKEWKAYKAERKKQRDEYWDSCSDDKKKVIRAMCSGAGYGHMRHIIMHQFLGKVCGYKQMPKQEIAYKIVAERLEEFLQWCRENGHEKYLSK